MKKIMTWLAIFTKKQIKNPFLVALILLMPLCAFLVKALPVKDSADAILVGICVDESEKKADELTLSLIDELLNGNYSVKFTAYDDDKKLIRDIQSKKVDCGYVLSPDLSQRTLENNSYMNSILILKQSGFSLQTSINEIVYAALIKLQGRNIILEYVDSTGLFTDVDVNDELMNSYDRYLNGSQTFHIIYQTYENGSEAHINPNNTSVSFPLRGIIAVLVSIVTIFGGIAWLKDKERGIFDAIPASSTYFCLTLYTLIPTILVSISGLITISISGLFTKWALELPALLIYILILEIYVMCFSLVIRKSRLLTACLPIIILGSLIFCPVFIDMSSYIPALSFVKKLFMPYYYLHFFG